MRVQAITNLGISDYPEYPLRDGESRDVPHSVGVRMVSAGHAIELPPDLVDEPPKPKTVVESVTIKTNTPEPFLSSDPATAKFREENQTNVPQSPETIQPEPPAIIPDKPKPKSGKQPAPNQEN